MPWNPFKDRDNARARFERLRHGLPMSKRQPDLRESSTQRGYGSKWQKYRAHFLSFNPLCARCVQFGRTEPAVVVDHVVPVKGARDPMFWKTENHQGLCVSCNNTKTAEDKKAGLTRPGTKAHRNTETDVLQEVAERAESSDTDQQIVKNRRGRPRKTETDDLQKVTEKTEGSEALRSLRAPVKFLRNGNGGTP